MPVAPEADAGATVVNMTAAVVGEEDPVTRRVAGVLTRHSYQIVFHHSPYDLLEGLSPEPQDLASAGVRALRQGALDYSPVHLNRPQSQPPDLCVFIFPGPRSPARGKRIWAGDWVGALKAFNDQKPGTAILVAVGGGEGASDIIKGAIAAGADEILSAGDAEIEELVWTRVQSALAKAEVGLDAVPNVDEPAAAAYTGVERRVAQRRREDRRRGGVSPAAARPWPGDVVEEWEEPTPADEIGAAKERVRAALDSLPGAEERRGPLAELLGVTAPSLRAESGRLDAKKIADRLGVSRSKLAQITPISRQALNDTPDSPRAQAALDPLARILDVLETLLPPEHVRAWLNAPHARLAGETPIHAILEGRAERVARMLEVARGGGVD